MVKQKYPKDIVVELLAIGGLEKLEEGPHEYSDELTLYETPSSSHFRRFLRRNAKINLC